MTKLGYIEAWVAYPYFEVSHKDFLVDHSYFTLAYKVPVIITGFSAGLPAIPGMVHGKL